MGKILRKVVLAVVGVGLIAAAVAVLRGADFAVLSPAGAVAGQQRNLLITATLLMLLIVVPVFGLTFYISWKYRAGNKKSDYQPEWDHNTKLESLWWAFPCAIILVLAVVAWNTSHSLDPSRALRSSRAPLTVQVIALQWKWLFIYPEQQIASLNYVELPVGRPVSFDVTSDAPMNSFWIPKLGGQIYAMAGMSTRLNLIADTPGTFYGSSANLSGLGFAAMNFTVRAENEEKFARWVSVARSSPNRLSLAAYTALARPNIAKTSLQYSSYEPGLYDTVMMKYTSPQNETNAAAPSAIPSEKMEAMKSE